MARRHRRRAFSAGVPSGSGSSETTATEDTAEDTVDVEDTDT